MTTKQISPCDLPISRRWQEIGRVVSLVGPPLIIVVRHHEWRRVLNAKYTKRKAHKLLRKFAAK